MTEHTFGFFVELSHQVIKQSSTDKIHRMANGHREHRAAAPSRPPRSTSMMFVVRVDIREVR